MPLEITRMVGSIIQRISSDLEFRQMQTGYRSSCFSLRGSLPILLPTAARNMGSTRALEATVDC